MQIRDYAFGAYLKMRGYNPVYKKNSCFFELNDVEYSEELKVFSQEYRDFASNLKDHISLIKHS